MSKRATRRPRVFSKPAYWDTGPPPEPIHPDDADKEQLSPTRYGDWVRKGVAVDF